MMKDEIQKIVEGCEFPTVLTQPDTGEIKHTNQATLEQLHIEDTHQLIGTRLEDWFSAHSIFERSVIWRYNEDQYRLSSEPVRFNDTSYIKTTIQPYEASTHLDMVMLQREMAEMLVHQFRSPLNGISGFTELLRERSSSEKEDTYIRSIEQGIMDMNRILNQLEELALDVSPHLATIEIQRFIQDILDEFSKEERSDIKIELPQPVKTIHTDYILLGDILIELLRNALDFRKNNEGPVKLTFFESGIIHVTNYGEPIPEKGYQKMFYPFYSTKARALGLGLAKCLYYANTLGYDLSLKHNSEEEGITMELKNIELH